MSYTVFLSSIGLFARSIIIHSFIQEIFIESCDIPGTSLWFGIEERTKQNCCLNRYIITK